MISPGQPLWENIFNLTPTDTLSLSPILYNSNKDITNKDYTFVWVVGEDTISTTDNLNMTFEQSKFGTLYSNLYLTDNVSKITYNIPFVLNVSASVNRGYFLLAEDDQHNTFLFLRSNALNGKFFNYNEFSGSYFGKYPLGLYMRQLATSSTNGTFVNASIATREGETPMLIADLKTNLPIYKFFADKAMAFGKAGDLFNPSFVQFYDEAGMEAIGLINGKVHPISKGVVLQDVFLADTIDYEFEGKFFTSAGQMKGFFLVGYDKKNEKIRIFANRFGGARQNYPKDYDKLIKMDTKGHEFMAGCEEFDSWFYNMFVTRKGNEVFLHRIPLTSVTTEPQSHQLVASKVIPGMEKASNMKYRTNSKLWYFTIGRTLYRFSSTSIDLQEVFTLPDDGTGDITAWNFDYHAAGLFKHIVVTTYNENANEPYKGSVYTYKIDGTAPVHVDKYVTHKVVALQCNFLLY